MCLSGSSQNLWAFMAKNGVRMSHHMSSRISLQTHTSSACSPHARVSHLSALNVKGHMQMPKVNQAANNKLAGFDKQMCGHQSSTTGGI